MTAARAESGPASYGVVIRDGRGEIVAKLKKYIGRSTNNVASITTNRRAGLGIPMRTRHRIETDSDSS